MINQELHGQLKALAWRTLKAVDHVDAKAADEGLHISPDWRAWRMAVRAVIRGDRMDIPDEPPRYFDSYKAHWDAVTSGTLGEARDAPVFEGWREEVVFGSGPVIEEDPRDAEIAALRSEINGYRERDQKIDDLLIKISQLEDRLATPVLELSNEPPEEALLEAYPDEDHAALKQRILAEFSSLRNMLIGQIPMTADQLNRLVALEHPKYQSWLQGVTK